MHIGSGRFSLLSVMDQDGKRFVLKRIKREFLRNKNIAMAFEKEMETWQNLGDVSLLTKALGVNRIVDAEQTGNGGTAIDSLSAALMLNGKTLDHTEWSHEPWIAREYVEGLSVADLVKKEGRWSLAQSLAFAITFCEAMEMFGNLSPGFVHCDIKPTKLMLTKDCKLKIVDLGMAKAAAFREAILAPNQEDRAFMAPETDIRHNFGVMTDIFSFGITFGCLVTGESASTVRRNGIQILKDLNISREVIYFFTRCTRRSWNSFSEIKRELLGLQEEAGAFLKCGQCGYIPRESREDCPLCGAALEVSEELKQKAAELKEEAFRMEGAGNLSDAARLLKKAFDMDPSLKAEYQYFLSCWQSGVRVVSVGRVGSDHE